ncbi:NOD2 [Symbiodinium pilosum]|uniref:NOD2 protein n=1 Tax=Symbiodinium pilosum TaxID=2952 RepID=A0A812XXE6_SYMPI|nr:NOD2 [Symbiodinium pilosum]
MPQVLTLQCAADGDFCKASCLQMSGTEVLELSMAPETPLWQVFASVAEAMTQPADSLRLITPSGQEILSNSQESLRSIAAVPA